MKEIPQHIKEKIDKLTDELKKVYELAEESWEGCDGCDENDKYFFMKGFQAGYNRTKPDEEALRLAKEMNKQPLTFVPSEMSEKYQQYRDWLNEIPEISDEEIEKASQEIYPVKKKDFMYIPTYGVINLEDSDKRFDINQCLKQIGFIAGIKWYKKQLKNKK